MAKKHIVCPVSDMPIGTRKIIKIGSRSIGVFNVDNHFYALLNLCPHQGANLCEGPVGGTNLPTDGYQYIYANEGKVLRCSRHGWEFDITTGKNFDDPTICAKTYPVTVEENNVVLSL